MTRPTIGQLRRLVGNPDAYAVQHEDGTWHPVRTPSWSKGDTVLKDHLSGAATVGTYVLNGDKTKTLVFDLDDPDDPGLLEKAEGIRDELVRLGVPERATLIEFSGRKGYHVWVVAADWVEAKFFRHLGASVLALTGLDCEVFPKQDSVKDLGNLIKLPFGMHRVVMKRSKLVTKFPVPASTQVLQKVFDELGPPPERAKRTYEGPDDVLGCVANIAAGVADGSRNTALYQYAVLLRGSHRVPDEQVDMLVRDAASKCDPPYGTFAESVELDNLLESSRVGGPVCEQLPDDIRCDDCVCVKKQAGQGLRPRAGALKYAGKGQGVVVNVEETRKTGDGEGHLITFGHPDIKSGGKARVK